MSEVEAVASRVAIIRSGKIIEVAETSSLIQRSLNRFTVRFKRPVEMADIARLPGVEVLSHNSQTSVKLQVVGDMERLIQVLGCMPVLDLTTEHLSLEDVFLSYYKK